MDWYGDDLMARVEAAASIALGEGALILSATAKQRAGVPVTKVGSKFVRSKPGEDPRRESGTYVSRLRFEHDAGSNALTAYVGSDDPVAGYLNVGTSKMRVRPNLANALDAVWPQISGRIINAVGTAISSGGIPVGTLKASDVPRFSEGPGVSPISDRPLFSPSEIPF